MNNNLSINNNNSKQIVTDLSNFLVKSKSLETICKSNKIDINDYAACVAYKVLMTPELQKCSKQSILDCCVKSAQIGLKIDANDYAYLTAFGGKCNVIVSYKGYIALIKSNNPSVDSITAITISKKDIEENRLMIEEGDNRKLTYKKNLLQSENSLKEEDIAGFLCIVYYKNKSYDYCYMTTEDVNRVREDSGNYKYSKDKTKTIWYKHYVAMGKKTTFRQLIKWCDFSGLDKINALDNEDFDFDKQKEEKKEVEMIKTEDGITISQNLNQD